MKLFDYQKPELIDFNTAYVRGDEESSCFIDCATDDICPDVSDLI